MPQRPAYPIHKNLPQNIHSANQVAVEILSTHSLHKSQDGITKTQTSSYYSNLKLSEAPRKVAHSYQSQPALTVEDAYSLSNISFKGTKSGKIWDVAKKPLSRNAPDWNANPDIIREKIGESLLKFIDLAPEFTFTLTLSKDIQSKTLQEIWNKYFASKNSNLFDFSTPFSMDMFKLLTTGTLIDTDMNQVMEIEKHALPEKNFRTNHRTPL